MFEFDWKELLALSVSPIELILRGSAIYWFLFALFRFILTRDVGSIGMADVLFVVIIADAAQNAMAGEYKSITDGIVLISTLAFWNFFLDWLSFRFPQIAFEAKPVCLARQGKIIYRNLRREFLTIDDLQSKLREHGIENVKDTKYVYMESDGSISVIQKNPKASAPST